MMVMMVGVALQFYKYTDVLTHPDTYTQSHLFQSRRRELENEKERGRERQREEKEGEREVGPRFLITPSAHSEDIPIR